MNLFTHDLHDDLTGTRPSIKINKPDFLPRSQRQLFVGKGNREGLPLELAAQMAVPVIFSRISGVVLPRGVLGNQTVPQGFGIGPQSWFIFENHHRRRGVFHEYRDNSRLKGRFGKAASD